MLTWLLFYTSLLDVDEDAASRTCSIPAASSKSQVVQSADGALRIVLNASQSARTQSSRFLVRGVRLRRPAHRVRHRRHLRDGRAAATRNGVALLPIPENYYDDLEARTDLDAGAHRRAAAPTTCSTTATAAREYFQVYTADLRGPLLLRDRRAPRLHAASAPPTRRSASPPRPGSRAGGWRRWSCEGAGPVKTSGMFALRARSRREEILPDLSRRRVGAAALPQRADIRGRGDLEKSAPLVSRPKFLANDSGLFPFRFCAVHPKDAGD